MAEVRLKIDLAHPSAQVWCALTDARVLRDWFMPTDLEAREGSRFTLEPGTLPGFLGPVTGQLIEVVPQQRLVMLWQGEKLHTRVVWEITATEGGCRLELVQSGFIGVPASLRGRALRATYQQLFAERLPEALDELAAAGFGGLCRPSRPRYGGPGRAASVGSPGPGLRAAAPSRRRSNAAVAAWSAGRVLRAGASKPAEVAARAADGAGPAAAPLWRRRAVAGTGCVVIALVLVAALGPGGFGRSALVPGPGEEGRPPGGATPLGQAAPLVTPAAGSSEGGTGVPAPGVEPRPGEAGAGATALSEPGVSGQPGALDPTGLPASPTELSVPGSPAPAESTPAPLLTARMATSGLPLLGGRAVEITVTNSGPGDADTWEVVTNVGSQNVTNVTGAWYERDGALAIFTPLAGLAGGTTTVVRFEIQAPVLGLLGATDPTSCTIDDRACG